MRRSLLPLAIAGIFAASFALGLTTERTAPSSDQVACGGTKPKPKPDNNDDDKKPKPSKPPAA